MAEELMNFDLPRDRSSIIKVIGVGGGGGNAVNHMFRQGITDVDFVICNTDHQALMNSPVPLKIQLGETLTQGRGAGNKPEQGQHFQIIVPKNTWFAARLTDRKGFALVGCTVSPGFHFNDFELATNNLLKEYPHLKNEIEGLIRFL